jgi:HK97 family phage portal protein
VTRFLPTLRRTSTKVIAMQSAMETKAVLGDYYSALQQFETGRRARNWPVERAVTEGYERVIWVFKAVNTIGADHARLPYRVKQDGKVVDDHPLSHVLNKQANPMETGQVLRKRLSAQISLSKPGAFVEIGLSNGGTIKRLDLLPPDRIEIVPGKPSSGVLVDHYRLTRRDGGIREIDPKQVRWFRDPHPLDPYSGVTPLEAAGLSVELDYFARLYNVSFMRNDGRPGGVLAVRSPDGKTHDISERHMDRIESRFGNGPHEAGKLSVIAGELSYVDLAAKPRDMQYGQTSRNSKIELLSAYGVPESVLGYAAERTFDNADAELYGYWTRTMPAHNEIIVSGFDGDSDDDMEGFLDTSSVEILERGERAKREEARNEFSAGLRSIKSYADLAGYGEEIESTPHTRALYVPSGKTPLPSTADDAKALGLDQPTDEAPPAALPPAAAPAALPPGAEDVAGPPALAAAPTPDMGQAPAGGALPPGWAPPGPAAVGAAPSPAAITSGPATKAIPLGARPVLRVKRATTSTVDQGEKAFESALDERARDRLEDTLTVALTILADRWINRTIDRMKSVKSRKGTRHWLADSPTDTRGGTKALDSAKAVDEERMVNEAETGTEPIVAEAAAVAAAALLLDLDADDEGTLAASVVVAGIVAAVVRTISEATARQAVRLIRLINEADQDEERSLSDIVDMIRDHGTKMTAWAGSLATQAATATMNGARDAAAEEVQATSSDVITRTWLSRRDEKVRHSHHEADGQQQPVGQPFLVGDSLLRFPCDPLAPPSETVNCRCRLLHRSKRTGRFERVPFATAV